MSPSFLFFLSFFFFLFHGTRAPVDLLGVASARSVYQRPVISYQMCSHEGGFGGARPARRERRRRGEWRTLDGCHMAEKCSCWSDRGLIIATGPSQLMLAVSTSFADGTIFLIYIRAYVLAWEDDANDSRFLIEIPFVTNETSWRTVRLDQGNETRRFQRYIVATKQLERTISVGRK